MAFQGLNHLVTWAMAALAKPENADDLLEREPETLCLPNELEPPHVGIGIDAIAGVGPRRPRQQALAFIEADGFHGHSGLLGNGPNLHVTTLNPEVSYMVKAFWGISHKFHKQGACGSRQGNRPGEPCHQRCQGEVMRRAEPVPRDQVLALGSLKLASNSSFSPDEEERAFTCRYLHQAVFRWVLELLAEKGLLKGKTVGIDATTLEANATLRSIVRRDAG